MSIYSIASQTFIIEEFSTTLKTIPKFPEANWPETIIPRGKLPCNA